MHTRVKITNKIINDLFEWAKNQQSSIPYEPQKINLSEQITHTVELFSENAAKKSIQIQQSNSNYFVFADTSMLDTIIRNLLANAIKFTPIDGTITINIDRADANFIKISIKDTGVGITQENIDKLLSSNEFFSSFGTEGEKGFGLGLKLCHEFVKTNKGVFVIESTLGKGSNFSFTLPKHKGLRST